MRIVWCLLLWCASATGVFAQVDVEVSNETGVFGRPVTMRILFPVDNEEVRWEFDRGPLSDIQDLNIIRDSVSVFRGQNGGFTAGQYISFAVYDTGFVSIPELLILPENGDTIRTNAFEYYIEPLPKADDKLAPIQPISREPLKLSDVLPYLYGLLGALLLVLIVRYIIRRRRKKDLPEVPAPVITITPLDEAMQAIRELREARLWTDGGDKDHYVQLSYLMRRYLERAFDIPALESTSGEIKVQLKDHGMPAGIIDEGVGVLRRSDSVKYAKFRISGQQCEDDLDEVERWIRNVANPYKKREEEE